MDARSERRRNQHPGRQRIQPGAKKSLTVFEVVAYLQLPEVREINEVFNFLVTGHQSAAGDVGEGGGDVGKGGEAVHPRGTNLERKDFLRKSVLWLLTPSSGMAKL